MEANDLNKAGNEEKELKKNDATPVDKLEEATSVPEKNPKDTKDKATDNESGALKDSTVEVSNAGQNDNETPNAATPEKEEDGQAKSDNAATKDGEDTSDETAASVVTDKESVAGENLNDTEKVKTVTGGDLESVKEQIVVPEEEQAKETQALVEESQTLLENAPEEITGEKTVETVEGKTGADEGASEESENKPKGSPILEKETSAKTTNEETKPDTAEKKPELDKVDLLSLSREQLVNRLRTIIKNFEVPVIKQEVEDIKASFYKQFNEEVEELKKKFLESGELEENFAPPVDHFEIEIKELLKDFRYRKAGYIHKLESEKDKNLAAKMEVIESIKNLINRQESLNETFNEFRALQQKFHDIGPIPQNKVRDVWDTYNLHIENFYNYVKINKELRDLDLKKNQELKEGLCEKAEKLLEDSSVVNSFKTLQKYHDRWREIGPVPKEVKDELWERFKAATTTINQKHQEYFEGLKGQLKENLRLKTELCEKAEEIVLQSAHSPKEWEAKSKKLIELQQAWKTIGFAPKKDNNKIYERFRTACDKFFENKREFFRSYKNKQQEHLKLKTELCERAEAMKESTDWKKTTDEYIKIQKEWKKIGPVPRRQSDAIWHRFRTACDAFFDNKSKFFSKIDDSQADNLKKKQDLIDELKAFENLPDNEDTFKLLQGYQRKFMEIGHVPYKDKDRINQEFRNEINKHFDALNMDEYQRNVQKFRNKLENIKQSGHQDDKLYQERNKLMAKLKQLENDIIVWENNIGFFAKSKSAESVIKDFKHKIETGKHNIQLLQEKIKMLDKLED
ncbi:protein of unknown function [Saccharicrinis carchari]|uniref:DUF349 domain-containing protein n=1 Tax=Saccharicrinis carchari TaxID=1168039 RepID=A0A521EP13_SACCC|nr:DUF349 domain-containing protein [Saccharicrinis carchari]SMO85656.1 protein of unknown function [Saccharicrinis carchari]